MGHRRPSSLSTWIVLLAVAVVLPLLLFTAYAIYWLTDEARSNDEARLEATAQTLALAADARLEAWVSALDALTVSNALSREDYRAFYEEARAVAAQQGGFIVLFDRSLQQIINTLRPFGDPLPKAGTPEPIERVFASGERYISDPFVGRVAQRWIIEVDIPVFRDGDVAYVLALASDLERISRLLLAVDVLPDSATARIVDSGGRVVAHTGETGPIGEHAGDWYVYPVARHGVVRGALREGTSAVVGVASLTQAPWTVAVAVPVSDLREAWDRPLVVFGAGATFLALMALAVALLLGRLVARPIRALAAAPPGLAGTEAIALPYSPIREIDELASSHRAAAQAVQQSLVEARRAAAAEERVRTLAESERALRESEEIKSRIIELALDAVITIDHEGRVVEFNPAAESIFGFSREQALGTPLADLIIPPRDRERHTQGLRRYLETGVSKMLNRRLEMIALHADGSEFPCELAASAGTLKGQPIFTGFLRDISERKRNEERQRVILGELDHRVRNTLASISAMTALIERSTDNKKAFAEALRTRLDAIAKAHGLLTNTHWQGAGLREVAELALAPYAGLDAARVRIDGPPIFLRPEAAVSLALAFFELATNAAKYGALSGAAGEIAISWSVDGEGEDEHLNLRWQEHGGPLVTAPRRSGFGSKVIQATFKGELDARLAITYAAEGLRLDAKMPLHEITVAAQRAPVSGEPRSFVPQRRPTPDAARGARILIVEDEVLIGLDLKAQLAETGADVLGPVGNLADALSLAEDVALDGALLDVNVGGAAVFPVADALARRGIPFTFVTGYDGREVLPPRFDDVPAVQKPVSSPQLMGILADLLRRGGGKARREERIGA